MEVTQRSTTIRSTCTTWLDSFSLSLSFWIIDFHFSFIIFIFFCIRLREQRTTKLISDGNLHHCWNTHTHTGRQADRHTDTHADTQRKWERQWILCQVALDPHNRITDIMFVLLSISISFFFIWYSFFFFILLCFWIDSERIDSLMCRAFKFGAGGNNWTRVEGHGIAIGRDAWEGFFLFLFVCLSVLSQLSLGSLRGWRMRLIQLEEEEEEEKGRGGK